ncbi:hypothetical protein [Ollibium composti]|uniref:Uncharacterized protein n=1 Tax=Ollibium composti TaxID=2675109 RepID=A0ABY2QCL9_9HYPH|nr:hypothetical protein [Mesorhizobium composti]THF58711.1 hypothetical protein E6C48_03365 [Mesorhizobium composti]
MDKIPRPRHEGRYPDRNIDCQEALDLAVRDLVDRAENAGWTASEAYRAIDVIIVAQRLAYDLDPDPAEDPA